MNLCIVDDHLLMREGLTALLRSCADVEVVAEASDAQSALAAIDTAHPDVMLLDVTLPGASGITVAREALRRRPELRILFFSMHLSEDFVADAFLAGAHGYVGKAEPVTSLIAALRAVGSGETYVSDRVSREAVDSLVRLRRERGTSTGPVDVLSSREREVFELLLQGLSNDDVASQLLISRRTVETHRAHLLKKLQLHSVADLFRFASRHGLITQ